jgi:hypothetical protein
MFAIRSEMLESVEGCLIRCGLAVGNPSLVIRVFRSRVGSLRCSLTCRGRLVCLDLES